MSENPYAPLQIVYFCFKKYDILTLHQIVIKSMVFNGLRERPGRVGPTHVVSKFPAHIQIQRATRVNIAKIDEKNATFCDATTGI